MNEKIRGLLQELGEAINEVVTQAPRIEQIMEAIRDSGYEVYLSLEANIAVEDRTEGASQDSGAFEKFTDDDRRFLKRLRIDT